jgi:hypothetical protein
MLTQNEVKHLYTICAVVSYSLLVQLDACLAFSPTLLAKQKVVNTTGKLYISCS